MIRHIVALATLSALAAGQTPEEARQRIQTRWLVVEGLLGSGVVREASSGLLEAARTLDQQHATTVAEENSDRGIIFAEIARASGMGQEEVALMYARRAQKRVAAGPPRVAAVNTGCGLVAVAAADVARLLQFMKQGMTYAASRNFDAALSEWRQGLKADPNYLGLRQNIGSALMAQRKFDDAEASLRDEVRLAGCLQPLDDAALAPFAQVQEVPEKDPGTRPAAQARALRERLPKVVAMANYNLACVYSLKQDKVRAVEALRAALASGFNDRKALTSDTDLAFVRAAPEFQDILIGIKH